MVRTPDKIRAAMRKLEERFDSQEISEKIFEMRYTSLRQELEEAQLLAATTLSKSKLIKLPQGITCRQFSEKQLAGHYRILKELGRGGMGIVYQAEDIHFQGQRTVAIKVLPQNLGQNSEILDNFKREFITASKLVHQNICAMYEFGEDIESETYFLVIEYLEGETLANILHKRKRYTFKDALPIIRQMADGLDFAHSKGILHLDIKPGNIMILPSGDVKIMDFGLARQLGIDMSHLHLPKAFGTPLYVAPEQIQAGKYNIVRTATDIWALGVICYEMLEGVAPFQGNTLLQLSHSIVNIEPKPIKRIPEYSWEAITKALSKIPQHRFSCCQEFLEALIEAPKTRVNTPHFSRTQKPKSRKNTISTSSSIVQKQFIARSFLAIFCLIFISLLALLWHSWPKQHHTISLHKETPPVETKNNIHPQVNSLPKSLIKQCWDDNTQLWNFATSAWEKLDINLQRQYASIYQKWYADRAVLPVEKVFHFQGTKIAMCLIPPGIFWMGSPEPEIGRYRGEIRHKVVISKSYWISKYEITQKQWESLMGNNPSYFLYAGPSAPVDSVSWEKCQKFTKKIHCRLPTEAEWEYVCRSGTNGMSYLGDFQILALNNAPDLAKIAWYAGNSGVKYKKAYRSIYWPGRQFSSKYSGTHPVGQKIPNAWKIYDMLGNACEWCQDWYGKYSDENPENPTGPSEGSRHVRRGGCWSNVAMVCRSANRNRWGDESRLDFMGFRIVMDIPSD